MRVSTLKLRQLRQQIDQVDDRLLRLLSRRAALAAHVGALKRRRGRPVYDGHREAAILRRVTRRHDGPLPTTAVRAIFQRIVEASRRVQERAQRGRAPGG